MAEKVKDIMAREPITVQAEDRVGEALALMVENRVSATPVVDRRERCVGVLSITDVVGVVRDGAFGQIEPDEFVEMASKIVDDPGGESSLRERRVQDLMTDGVVSVEQETTVVAAAQEMVRSRVHRLVVLDGNRRAVGIVSTLDLLEVLSGK